MSRETVVIDLETSLRSRVRLLLLAGWTGLNFLGLLGGVVLGAVYRPGRVAWRRQVFRAWARGVARLLGVRIGVRGAAPEAPFFLVANHLSYLDIVVLATELDCVFVAKQEVRGWAGLGLLASLTDTIFVDRTLKRDALRVHEELDSAIAGGDGVVLFAEATSTAGESVLPFRPALLDWAARAGWPVHHASLSYRTPPGAAPAHLAVCWWGEMTFGPHLVGLSRLPSIEATVEFGGAPIRERDRKHLAVRLHRAVAERFVPVVNLEP